MTMRCAKCGIDNPAANSYCTICGARLEAAAPVMAPDTTPSPLLPAGRFCGRCGSAVGDGNAYCGKCGAMMSSPPPAKEMLDLPPVINCSQCGASAQRGKMFCSRCGKALPQEDQTPVPEPPAPVIAAFCSACGTSNPTKGRFCQTCGRDLQGSVSGPAYAPAPGHATPAQNARQGSRLPPASLIVIGLGAILMLVAMVPDWISLRCSGKDCGQSLGISWGDLARGSNDKINWHLNYLGYGLPLILLVVFGAVALLSLIYSWAKGKSPKRLWIGLGILSLLGLLVNFIYILVEAIRSTTDITNINATLYATPAAGWILAFVGAVMMIIGAAAVKSVDYIRLYRGIT